MMHRKSPVEAALASKVGIAALRAGMSERTAFALSLLDRPSVRRSKRYRREVLAELVSVYCYQELRGEALNAASEAMQVGFESAGEALLMAANLYLFLGEAVLTLQILEDGYRHVGRDRNTARAAADLLKLKRLELDVRAGAFGSDFDFEDLLRSISALERPAGDFDDLRMVRTLQRLVENGNAGPALRAIAENSWAHLQKRQRFEGDSYPWQLATLESIVGRTTDDDRDEEAGVTT